MKCREGEELGRGDTGLRSARWNEQREMTETWSSTQRNGTSANVVLDNKASTLQKE